MYVCVCVCIVCVVVEVAYECVTMCVKVCGVGSLLLLFYGFQGKNPGLQASWQEALLAAEPSHWSKFIVNLYFSVS